MAEKREPTEAWEIDGDLKSVSQIHEICNSVADSSQTQQCHFRAMITWRFCRCSICSAWRSHAKRAARNNPLLLSAVRCAR